MCLPPYFLQIAISVVLLLEKELRSNYHLVM